MTMIKPQPPQEPIPRYLGASDSLLCSKSLGADLKQFSRESQDFQAGLREFQTKLQQLQAETQRETNRIRIAVAALQVQTTPQRSPGPVIREPAHQVALTAFKDQGLRLWQRVYFGLTILSSFVLSATLVELFEPQLLAWLTPMLGR